MVKIINDYGDKYTGKCSNAIYQKVHGQQVRRKAYKQTKEPSQSQIKVRTKFKEAIAWVKTLTSNQRSGLRSYYKRNKVSYDPNYPVNWYNFAKWLYIKNPEFVLLDSYTNEYTFSHPAILQVIEKDMNGSIVYSDENLSSLEDGVFQTLYHKFASVYTRTIEITLVTGQIFTYLVTPPVTELLYFDIRFFSPKYFV